MFSRYSRLSLSLLALALYLGPVLAGLAGHGGATLPVFTALFLLYVAATRKPDLSQLSGWAELALIALVQLALVSASFGLGLIAAQAFGSVMLPVWAPIALTGVCAAFGVWAFRDAAEMDVMMDSVLDTLDKMDRRPILTGGDPWPEPSAPVRAAVDRAVMALRAAERPAASLIDPIVQALEAEVGADGFDALFDAAGETDTAEHDLRVDFGLLRFVASPAICQALIARGEGGLAPMLLLNAADPDLRAEARARLAELIDAGAPKNQLPDPSWLAELDQDFPGEGFDRLIARRVAAAE